MLLGMSARSIAGRLEQHRRWIGSAEGPVISDIDPGAAGVGLGATFAIVAKVQWDDAQTGCIAGAFNRCSTQAVELGEQANDSAVAATALFIGGAASLAGGAVLWLAFPGDSTSPAVSLSLRPPTHGLGTVARAEWMWP